MWTEPGADFVYIEPWCGMSQFGLPCNDISEKNGIHKLEENGTYTVHHIISSNTPSARWRTVFIFILIFSKNNGILYLKDKYREDCLIYGTCN